MADRYNLPETKDEKIKRHLEHDNTSNYDFTPQSRGPKWKSLLLLASMAVLGFFYTRYVFVGGSLAFWHASPAPEKWTPIRKIVQHETSNSIQGVYTLYDLLDLSTTSGSIHITIDVQSGRRPAVVKLSTESGSIRADYSSSVAVDSQDSYKNDLNGRTFRTEIKSNAGAVHVDSLLHGNGGWTTIETTAGSIYADILTFGVGAGSNISSISTRSQSGSQQIQIRSAFDESNSNLTALRAEHYSTGSASIQAEYPSEWEGLVHASVGGSADVKVEGSNLEYSKRGTRDVYAWRGDVDETSKPNIEVRVDGSATIRFKC